MPVSSQAVELLLYGALTICRPAVTMDEIKLVLAEEAKERVEQGLGSLHQGVTPSAFLFLGLLIENLQ